jgi:tetratricopeptide (TPR) repeat protein
LIGERVLFPSESLDNLRREVLAQIESGKISREAGFRRLVEADPLDAYSWAELGNIAYLSNDADQAEECARRFILSRPASPEAYFAMGRALALRGTSPLADAYDRFGISLVELDDPGLEHFDVEGLAAILKLDYLLDEFPPEEVFRMLTRKLVDWNEQPPEVQSELEPCHLIRCLRFSRDDVLDTETVDRIVLDPERCAPLLLGVLKQYADEQLTDNDYYCVERALALLGEIGDPVYLPAIVEFFYLEDDEMLGPPSGWALRRIATLRPREAADAVRAIIREASVRDRSVLAEELGMAGRVLDMPSLVPDFIEGMERAPRREREDLIFGLMAMAFHLEGRNSPLAASMERRFAGEITSNLREQIRGFREQVEVVDTLMVTNDELTVYDICSRLPEKRVDEDEEFEPPQPFVRAHPIPGRNDPCWCGSGKKYKKCHLDQDAGRG